MLVRLLEVRLGLFYENGDDRFQGLKFNQILQIQNFTVGQSHKHLQGLYVINNHLKAPKIRTDRVEQIGPVPVSQVHLHSVHSAGDTRHQHTVCGATHRLMSSAAPPLTPECIVHGGAQNSH